MQFCCDFDDFDDFSSEASELDEKLNVLIGRFEIDSNFENLRKGIDKLTIEIKEISKNTSSSAFGIHAALILDKIEVIDECYQYHSTKDKNQKNQLEEKIKETIGWYGEAIDTVIKKSLEFRST